MDNANMARVLQNMVDEAEENIEGLAAAFHGYEGQVNINQRRADFAEAVALVEELNKPQVEASGELRSLLRSLRQMYSDGVWAWTDEQCLAALSVRPQPKEPRAEANGYSIRPELESLGISDPDDPDVCIYDKKGEWVATVKDYATAQAIVSNLNPAPTAEKRLREAGPQRIYVASSWKNDEQPGIVRLLRAAGCEVYDFRHPREGDDGFSWSEIDPAWKDWTPEQYIEALAHPVAQRGFGLDWGAMEWADTGVLVLPCGKSAHLEAGYFVGAGKRLYILMLDQNTPELMYKMATKICTSEGELCALLAREAPKDESAEGKA